ncbi:HesA/MoeB/ThiF family protein [Alteromonas gilva]|uniref:HesA/MoeB/ThiF family protein n=1 Tax=Alteromonas gilva TaxID=2987522 RepID=A0ABT5L4R0_9ALTE|nr:HesA/MoeB/ThiF family protein [Alteromonas gilva]MDC8832020.1 HesA/MoeB/ThiF family protein [Alteromonas gilva]
MLTNNEYTRYSRQLLVEGMDDSKQADLGLRHVVIIGLGGLGCASAAYLAGAGVGTLRLVDDDEVALSNLPRQQLYTEQDVGLFKVEAAAAMLRQRNSAINLEPHVSRFTDTNGKALIRDADIVLDCSDNMQTRQHINAACYATGTPLIVAAASGVAGQLLMLHPKHGHGCYQCLYTPEQGPVNNCLEQGILGPVVGVLGVMQALNALLFLLKMGNTQWGMLMLYNALTADWRTFSVPALAGCSVCGEA